MRNERIILITVSTTEALLRIKTMTTITLNPADCRLHHTSLTRGYVSRKDGTKQPFTPYKGRFGEGFTRLLPNWGSTNYSFIEYYIVN